MSDALVFETTFGRTFPIIGRGWWNRGLLWIALVLVVVGTFGMPVFCHPADQAKAGGRFYQFYLCDERGYTAPTLSYFISVGGGAGIYNLVAFTPIVVTFLWNLELRMALRVLRARFQDVVQASVGTDKDSEDSDVTSDGMAKQVKDQLDSRKRAIDLQYYLMLLFSLGFFGLVMMPTTFAANEHICMTTFASLFLVIHFVSMVRFDFHLLPAILCCLGVACVLVVAGLLFVVGLENEPGQVASWAYPYNYTYWFVEALGFSSFLCIPIAYFFVVSSTERIAFLLEIPMPTTPKPRSVDDDSDEDSASD